MSIIHYQYPSDLKEEDSYKKIYFCAYETLNRDFGDPNQGGSGILNTKDTLENLKAIITLPMPETLGDDLSHTWEKKDTLESLDSAAGAATDGMVGLAALSSIFKSLKNIAPVGIGSLALSKLVTQFLNAGKTTSIGLMSMFSGARKTLVNPDYWQNYTGSDPRSFDFTYVFQPRNKTEALYVLNILRTFKMLTSPRLETSIGGDAIKSLKGIIKFDELFSSNEEETQTNQETTDDSFGEIQNFFGNLSKASENSAKKQIESLGKFQSYVGAIKQPHYWKIILGNEHLNKLTKMTELVCTKVSTSFGDSKLEVFNDGIPKIMKLTLNFSEIKLKYENDFENEFTFMSQRDNNEGEEKNSEAITKNVAENAVSNLKSLNSKKAFDIVNNIKEKTLLKQFVSPVSNNYLNLGKNNG